MRIALIAVDTRGGVQPYVALAVGLKQAGHEVRLVAPADFVELADEAGITIAPLSGSVEEVARKSAASEQGGSLAGMRVAARELRPRIHAWTREALEACTGVDLIAGGIGGMAVGVSVADRLAKPFIPAHLQPVDAATTAYPGVLLSGTPRGPFGVGWWLSHRVSSMAVRLPFRSAVMSARREVLGLTGPPRAADGQPVLYGFSRHVVPVPDGAGRRRHVTGYWRLPVAPGWHPSRDLEAFLAGPRPIVSIGFGSMSSDDAAGTARLVVAAVRDAGVRAVLLSGWGGLASTSEGDDVFGVDSVPHEWLFPRVDAVVHHGGAGTTGAGLAAGLPSVVIPHGVDQPFWASRVAALGVGPPPIPRKQLTRERLAAALSAATGDAAMIDRAREVGRLISAEDGVAAAVTLLTAPRVVDTATA